MDWFLKCVTIVAYKQIKLEDTWVYDILPFAGTGG